MSDARDTTEATPAAGGPAVWLREIRVHQWVKNSLIVVPAAAAHLAPSAELAATLAQAFLSFSLLASAGYLANDVADLEHDRLDARKRERPVAAGRISVAAALVAAVACLVVSLALAWRLPGAFRTTWAAYFVLTSAYSAGLKRVVMLDVVMLAALYTVRVVAGAAAVDVSLSRWFLAFSVFMFASLALLKRLVEANAAGEAPGDRIAGRGWKRADAPVLLAFGAASAVAAALVYCLYISGSDVARVYARPDALWLGLPAWLFWLGRLWLLGNREQVADDPLVFALRDPVSYGVLAYLIGVVWVAT